MDVVSFSAFERCRVMILDSDVGTSFDQRPYLSSMAG